MSLLVILCVRFVRQSIWGWVVRPVPHLLIFPPTVYDHIPTHSVRLCGHWTHYRCVSWGCRWSINLNHMNLNLDLLVDSPTRWPLHYCTPLSFKSPNFQMQPFCYDLFLTLWILSKYSPSPQILIHWLCLRNKSFVHTHTHTTTHPHTHSY